MGLKESHFFITFLPLAPKQKPVQLWFFQAENQAKKTRILGGRINPREGGKIRTKWRNAHRMPRNVCLFTNFVGRRIVAKCWWIRRRFDERPLGRKSGPMQGRCSCFVNPVGRKIVYGRGGLEIRVRAASGFQYDRYGRWDLARSIDSKAVNWSSA